MLVAVHGARAAFHGHLDRHDLVLEDPRCHGPHGLLLAAGGELVLFLAADPVLLGEVLRGDAHVDVVEGIPQAVVHHRVDQLGVAHTRAEARRRHQVRSARHILHAAGGDDVDVACADHLRGDRNGFESGSADHVDRRRGHLLRDPRADRGLARWVLSEPGREDAPEHDLVHLVAGDLSSLERGAQSCAPSSVAATSLNCPPKLPTGVRTALTITASSITASSERVTLTRVTLSSIRSVLASPRSRNQLAG